MGCRCIELDLWDGADGQPLITHGNTLCSRVSLLDVSKAIAKDAFTATPFPLVLSLENHLSIEQQVVAARIFETTFGEMLAVPPPGHTEADALPSPSALKRKILIKGKGLDKPGQRQQPANARSSRSTIGADANGEGARRPPPPRTLSRQSTASALAAGAAKTTLKKSATLTGKAFSTAASVAVKAADVTFKALETLDVALAGDVEKSSKKKLVGFEDEDDKDGNDSGAKPRDDDAELESEGEEMGEGSEQTGGAAAGSMHSGAERHLASGKHHKAVAPELARIVFLSTRKWKPADAMGEPPHWMASHAEENAHPLVAKPCYARVSSRTPTASSLGIPGPGALRQRQHGPLPFWAVGVQMVGLNFQRPDTIAMHLNDALFRMNAGCGYVLKPFSLRKLGTELPLTEPSRKSAHAVAASPALAHAPAPASGGKHHHHDKKAEKKKKTLKKPSSRPSVAVASITLLWAEHVPLPGEELPPDLFVPIEGDKAIDYAPPPGAAESSDAASSAGWYGLRGGGGSSYLEPLRPYVTVDVLGGHPGSTCGASHSLLSVVNGSTFTSDWADSGLAPAWHQTGEAATTDPEVSFVHFAICRHREYGAASATKEDVLAMAVVPWWSLREGVRSIPLTDRYGRKLVLARLVVSMHFRGDRLTDESARRRVHSDLRPPGPLGRLAYKGIDVTAAIRDKGEEEMDFEVPVVAFKHKTAIIAEEAGAVRLAVKRKSGDAPCLVNFSTSDGTAAAGYDYTPQTGQLFFLRGQKTKEIKVLIIDDDEAEGAKSFYVTLSQPENCTLKKSKSVARVIITDDDFDFYRAIKRSYWWTLLEIVLMIYALMGNELVMMILIEEVRRWSSTGSRLSRGRPWTTSSSMPTSSSSAFFALDMMLQFCIQGVEYITGGVIRFVLDLLATVLLLPSAKYFDEVIWAIALLGTGGNDSAAQKSVDAIQQGTLRASLASARSRRG